ncbi:uncharacterized protein UTRI_00316 [Ustilago trichophora]|uniref:Uncharacterized protein n=1 Tax=Ustilago trichophora TaxID=86804 RepID=A0A5C3DUY5_9BASI|nr:uncharacterized protein UTRI_00316 [Ustilago trichophora]
MTTAVVNWYEPTATKNYDAYCTKGGALASEKHVCFNANPEFFTSDLRGSNFHGILDDHDHSSNFVMLPIRKTSIIHAAHYTITVDFSLPDSGISRNCAAVTINQNGAGSGLTVCQPGASPVDVPTWLS